MQFKKYFPLLIIVSVIICGQVFGQKPYRVGTTAASFLEVGIGSIGISLGDAYTASANDLSSIYWNPAGLANMETNQALFVYQPWIADINSLFAGFGILVPEVGTLGLSIFGMDYGDIEVTNMEYQEGTGEKYSAYDYVVTLSYARKLVTWFSFGASAKYITSKIWHTQASAFALDLGVQVQTHLLSFSGRREEGLKIGMSIANYGSRMRYGGKDLLFPVDIDPDNNGNYQNAQGEHTLKEWELPLIFRVGIAVDPLVSGNQKLTLSADALHPNNMSEYVNLGAQYKITYPGKGDFFLRAGYKALFAHQSLYGATFGGGLKLWIAGNNAINLDYAFQSIGVLGSVHCTSVGFSF